MDWMKNNRQDGQWFIKFHLSTILWHDVTEINSEIMDLNHLDMWEHQRIALSFLRNTHEYKNWLTLTETVRIKYYRSTTSGEKPPEYRHKTTNTNVQYLIHKEQT